MVVRVCIDAQHSPFVTSLAFPQGIAPGENIELYIGTWDLPESPPPKANTIVVDPLTKVVHVARKLDAAAKRKAAAAAAADPSGPDGTRKKLLVTQKGGHRLGVNSTAGHAAKSAAGNSTNSVGTGRNKCGECGQVFDSIKEISIHMQRHLAEKVPHEKSSVVTLTHRPKDGSPPSKATITQDPNYRNRVEVSIPLAAAETFLQTVLDQAQQILLKHMRPPAGGTFEVRKTDSCKEGDSNRSIILEALEQVDNTDPPVAQEAVPPQRTQSTPLASSKEHNNSSASTSYPSMGAASTTAAAAAAAVSMPASGAPQRTRSQEIDDVERALEAIHGGGAGDLPPANLIGVVGLPQANLREDQRAGPSFDSQEASKMLLAHTQAHSAGPSHCAVQMVASAAIVDPPAAPAEQGALEGNGDQIHHVMQHHHHHQPGIIPVEQVQLIPERAADQNDGMAALAVKNQIEQYEQPPAIAHNAQLEGAAGILEHPIPDYPAAPIMPAVVGQLPLAMVEPQIDAVQQQQQQQQQQQEQQQEQQQQQQDQEQQQLQRQQQEQEQRQQQQQLQLQRQQQEQEQQQLQLQQQEQEQQQRQQQQQQLQQQQQQQELQAAQEAAQVEAIQADIDNAQLPHHHHQHHAEAVVEPAEADEHQQQQQQQQQQLPREVDAAVPAAQLIPNVEPPRPSLRVIAHLSHGNMLALRHNVARAGDDGMQDEIGSSSEAVASTPHSHSRTLMDPREPTSSADVDSTVGEADGGQGSPDDGGVDSTSASSSSHGHGIGAAACQRILDASAEAAIEEPMMQVAPAQRHEANAALNEAAARVAGRFHQGQEAAAAVIVAAAAVAANNQAALGELIGNYALQDEMQEPHSGMQ